MRYHIGIDVAEDAHWVTAIDNEGRVVLDQRVQNTPAALSALTDALAHLGGERRVGLDLLGGIASLLTAMLVAAGEQLVHVSGLAVNRAREGTRGGDHKSDPRDARVIADQVRTRPHLRPIETLDHVTAELRLLVGRRRDLVVEQTRRLNRLHELLGSVPPGLERRLELTCQGPLHLLTRYVTSRLPSDTRAGAWITPSWRRDRLAGAQLAPALAPRLSEAFGIQATRRIAISSPCWSSTGLRRELFGSPRETPAPHRLMDGAW